MLGLLVSAVTMALGYSLILVISWWCWLQLKHFNTIKIARQLPCAKNKLPLLGHTHLFLRGAEEKTKMLLESSIEAVSKKLYNVCLWCGPMPMVIIQKPEEIQRILTSSGATERGDELSYVKYALGNGLLTGPGHIVKITRRYVSPLFIPRNMEQMMKVFNSNSKELALDIKEHVGESPFDILHPAMGTALKTVCQLIFGAELQFDTKSVEFQDLLRIVELIPTIFSHRVTNPLSRIDCIFKFIYRKELNEIDRVWKTFTEIPLKVAKNNLENKSLTKHDENMVDLQEGPVNLVDVYTELQKKHPQFTDSDLKSEMVTLYCTGTDTVGLAVSTCLLALAKHSDMQNRLYEEIDSVVGPDDDVTTAHLGRMQYLDMVYKEALRWGLIVPYLSRKTSEDISLDSCTIPAGIALVVGVVGPHMDPSIYPDPRMFDPERFSPENSTSRSRNAFLPFGAGGRMCVAKTYAEYLVKTMLVHVLRRYQLFTDMDIYNLKKVLKVTLVNSDGYNIKLQPRN